MPVPSGAGHSDKDTPVIRLAALHCWCKIQIFDLRQRRFDRGIV